MRLAIESVAEAMVKVVAGVVAPPVVTVMLAVPAAATRFEFTVALSCVALRTVVGSGAAFHKTCASGPNPVPFTVKVKDALPAATDVGLRLVIELCALAQKTRQRQRTSKRRGSCVIFKAILQDISKKGAPVSGGTPGQLICDNL